jgi:hypothetical protein
MPPIEPARTAAGPAGHSAVRGAFSLRATYVLTLSLLGLALVGAVQWAANGAPGLPALPAPWPQLLPTLAFFAFGLYLAAVYGGSPGPALALPGALCALVVAGLPLAYAYGWAQRYGLPADAGAFGALYAAPLARSAAALWLAVAAVGAFRRPRTFGRLPHAAGGLPPAEPAPLWSPAPPPAEPTAVAYTPEESPPG